MIKTKRINLNYLKMYEEIIFFILLYFKKKDTNGESDRILIVNPGLIGEFVSSLPAIHDFIVRNKHKKVDLLIPDNQIHLAENISGINKVHGTNIGDLETSYDSVVVMRVNRDAYKVLKKIRAKKFEIKLNHFAGQGLHVLKCQIFGNKPKQWSEINFNMLGGRARDVEFDNIFSIKDKYRIENVDSGRKSIIVHTGSEWIMKRWNSDKWVELLNKINVNDEYQITFIGSGSVDIENYKYIEPKLKHRARSFIGSINLSQSIQLLNHADYFLGIDSGPQNMARITGVKSVVIFGPGPHMYLPNEINSIAIDHSQGRGLYEMFFHRKNKIIDQIEVDEVYNAFLKLC